MTALRGWCRRGQRLPGKAPLGKWRTMTFLAALRHDRLVAPWVLEGAINAGAFRTYVQKVLCPTLRQGDVVVMDNLSSHKDEEAGAAIRKAGAHLLFLPPYSPDLNPIEQVFAKLKHFLRAEAARSQDQLYDRIAHTLTRFKPDECGHYLANSGYASI